MMDYEVVISLQVEALRALEARAIALRAQIERKDGKDFDAACRLETIERILGRIYGEAAKRSAETS